MVWLPFFMNSYFPNFFRRCKFNHNQIIINFVYILIKCICITIITLISLQLYKQTVPFLRLTRSKNSWWLSVSLTTFRSICKFWITLWSNYWRHILCFLGTLENSISDLLPKNTPVVQNIWALVLLRTRFWCDYGLFMNFFNFSRLFYWAISCAYHIITLI